MPFQLGFLFAPDKVWAYALYAVPSFGGLIYASLSYTAMQELVGLRMRALASAIMLFSLTLVGIGGGPVLAGALSDLFAPTYGDQSLRLALAAILPLNLVALYFLHRSASCYREAVSRARTADQ